MSCYMGSGSALANARGTGWDVESISGSTGRSAPANGPTKSGKHGVPYPNRHPESRLHCRILQAKFPPFMKKTSNQLNLLDPRLLWAKAEAEFRLMTDAEKAQTLVAAGLFTPSLKPAKRYRDLFVKTSRAK